MITEKFRTYLRDYYRIYRNQNREKVRAIERRSAIKHRQERYRRLRENYWRIRIKRKPYFESQEIKELVKRNVARAHLVNRIELRRMHISKKLLLRFSKIVIELNKVNLKETTDLEYFQQIKIRAEACKLLAKLWNKETCQDLKHTKELE